MMSNDQPKIDYDDDPVFLAMQYKFRQAFEEGWRMAGGDPLRSPWNKEPVGWRKAWIESQSRAWLVENQIISGDDLWR